MQKQLSLILFFFLILLVKTSAFSFFNFGANKNILNTIDTITISIVLPISGKDAEISNDLLKSILISKEDLDVKNIVLKVYDTKSTKDGLVEAFNLLKKDNPKIILGPISSEQTQHLLQLINEDDTIKPLIFSFSNDVESIKSYNNSLILGYLVENEVDNVLDFVIDKVKTQEISPTLVSNVLLTQKPAIAIIAPENQYGDLVVSQALKYLESLNLKAVRVVRYPANEIKITQYFQNLIPQSEIKEYIKMRDEIKYKKFYITKQGDRIIKAIPPQLDFNILLVAEYGKQLPIVTSHIPAFDIDYKNLNIVGLSTWNNDYAIKDEFLQGAFFSGFTTQLTATNFASKYRSMLGKNPTQFVSLGYDVWQIVLHLLEQNQSLENNANKNNDASFNEEDAVKTVNININAYFNKIQLLNTTFNGVLADFSFEESGNIKRYLAIRKIFKNNTSVVER
jgi:hypothetical protein